MVPSGGHSYPIVGHLTSEYAEVVRHHLHPIVKVKLLSRLRLLVTPWTAAHQAPPSMRFSRQEYWSGLPFLSPMCESEVAQSCPTLSDPMDCSLPGSCIHGIFQARVLEWGAIAFSILLALHI